MRAAVAARAAESGQSFFARPWGHSSSRASHCLHTGHQSIGELNIGVTSRSYLIEHTEIG
ncbi:MAG: hypothetical protein A3G81_13775 [Betaproteobacteria bacterium RIFCSPLOWO2_12_FULL_65_14]|nr:MAG: hypothetical protein A3G81_13775 [Betaproteobacteria bacterium RIFCSPLOWO2_12_FULL_65_14]